MRIINSHTHPEYANPKALLSVADQLNCEKIGVMAVPCYYSALNTLECLLMKRMAPERVYLFGGMTYLSGYEPTGQSHEIERRAGTAPRPISESGLNAYVNWLMPKLSPEDQKKAK